ncbi:MAG: asparagine synthase (glutamine-hydrolyzing) [Flavobacteriales bacterium]|nr:asparagine synthase (glutamine-hydrolyzing) [Flavobacteriales bacterium]
MCGINGIVDLKHVADPAATIKVMNDRLAHRGPDAEGSFINDTVALGHRRLSIIDLSDAGNQPFHSFDGKQTLVFNGEIYNYIELKANLADYPFKTGSDTEVLIAAYRKWGKDCLLHLNGMFAFALWDEDQRSLLIARDRMGIKPLYFAWQGNGLVFSSEMRALLSSNLVKKKVDPLALVDYLRYQTVHAPRTMIEEVQMLEPGTYMLITDSETINEHYWHLAASSKQIIDDRDRILKNINESLHRSVEMRMRADVPFGAFLSGGIDSSAIVGLMAGVTDHPVSTFSVTFDEEEFSEGVYAEMIAKKFNTRHTEIRLQADDFLHMIPDALKAMDHPSGDGPNTYVVSKVTKESGITMALSGLGGDELFAGYGIFTQATALLDKRWVMSFPKFLRSFAGRGLQLAKPSIASRKTASILKEDYLDLEYFYPYSRQALDEKQVGALVKDKLPKNAVHQFLLEEMAQDMPAFGLNYLSKISYAEIRTYMQNVLLRDSDQMSMAHALEVRVPFLDHELVEYVMGVADPEKYPHTPKKLLDDSLGTLLPREIVDRPKMGFTLPWEQWMKGTLRSFCEEKLQRLGEREYFNARGVDQTWQSFLNGSKLITWSRIWHLVVLENWLQEHGIE